MNKNVFFFLCFVLAKSAGAQLILPVQNLHVDESTFFATWDAPKITLLYQDFESPTFPPTGWNATTANDTGWIRSDNWGSTYFVIPQHTFYAVANDDKQGATANGCCDFLITPVLNLTSCDSFHLIFDSYFNGNNAQKATIEMSTDAGVTWTIIQEITHFPNWKNLDIDLSQWSGSGGLSAVQFAFHADDQGNQASGWAIDHVIIQSVDLGVIDYSLYLEQNFIATITETEYNLADSLPPCGSFNFCVHANYQGGLHADTCIFFYATAPPVQNMQVLASDTGVLFTWEPPVNFNVYGYNVYLDSDTVITFPADHPYYFCSAQLGNLCIDVTLLYELEICGFPPGTYAESYKKRACGTIVGFDLPFQENWTSGSSSLNKWTLGDNWSISGQQGNEAPCIKFEAGKSPGSYSSDLSSWSFNSMGFDYCPNIVGATLTFDIKLDDLTESGTEFLDVKLILEDDTVLLKRFLNTGSFDWYKYDIDITTRILDHNFGLLFSAYGVEGGQINAWLIDNIELSWYISDGYDYVSVAAKRQGNPENNVLVSWEYFGPLNAPENHYGDYQLNMDESFSLQQPGTITVGNRFSNGNLGILKKASVFMKINPDANAEYSIWIFDHNRNFLGESATFQLDTISLYGFKEVVLPDIPYTDSFYAMLHIVSSSFSDGLVVDPTPYYPNAQGFIYNGSTWLSMAEAGLTPGGLFVIYVQSVAQDWIEPPLNECSILGYNIYRDSYTEYPGGPNPSPSNYQFIGSVPYGTNEFLDKDLLNSLTNCYQYTVKIQYPNWESGLSGSDWDCIFVDIKEPKNVDLNIYPNPASEILSIETNSPFETITIYNLTGKPVAGFQVSNRQNIQINVSQFAPGMYNLRFRSATGESFNRKFVKL